LGAWHAQGGAWNRMRGCALRSRRLCCGRRRRQVALRFEVKRQRRLQHQAFQSVSLRAPLRRGSSLERSSRHGAMFLHLRESHAALLALLPAQQSDFSRHRAWGFAHSRPYACCPCRVGRRRKATSLIASGETGPIHMAACGAASRDYVFDGREL
jgi:hypothetical protein